MRCLRGTNLLKAVGRVLWFGDADDAGVAVFVAGVRARRTYANQAVVFAGMDTDARPWDLDALDTKEARYSTELVGMPV